MSITASSDPGAVEHDRAIWLLEARAVLTTAVCRELDASANPMGNRRSWIALIFLRTWIRDELGAEFTWPGDGLPKLSDDGQIVGSPGSMTVPDDGQALLREIIAGVPACHSLAMTRTADTQRELNSDIEKLAAALAEWRTARDAGFP